MKFDFYGPWLYAAVKKNYIEIIKTIFGCEPKPDHRPQQRLRCPRTANIDF